MPKTKEQVKAYNKEYFSRPEVIERAKERNSRYRARRAEYKTTEAGKAAEKRYRSTEPSIKYQHEYRIKKLYGITEAEYQDMYQAQGGMCQICTNEVEGRLHIDHNHDTGEVRGLLCGSCNRGIGLFSDQPELLRKAADYLS